MKRQGFFFVLCAKSCSNLTRSHPPASRLLCLCCVQTTRGFICGTAGTSGCFYEPEIKWLLHCCCADSGFISYRFISTIYFFRWETHWHPRDIPSWLWSDFQCAWWCTCLRKRQTLCWWYQCFFFFLLACVCKCKWCLFYSICVFAHLHVSECDITYDKLVPEGKRCNGSCEAFPLLGRLSDGTKHSSWKQICSVL